MNSDTNLDNANIVELNNQLEALTQKNSKLSIFTNDLLEMKELNADELFSLQYQLEDTIAENLLLEKEQGHLKKIIDDNSMAITRLNEKNALLESQLSNTMSEFNCLKSEFETLTAKNVQLSNELKNCYISIESSSKQIELLKTINDNHEKSINHYVEQMKHIVNDIIDMKLSRLKRSMFARFVFKPTFKHNKYKKIILKHGMFDSIYYLTHYQDARLSELMPLDHFVHIGLSEDRKPNEEFDPAWYRNNNQDVVDNGAYPFIHYCIYGKKEGRAPKSV